MKIIPRRNVDVGWPEVRMAWKNLCSGTLIQGPDQALFEKEFARYLGVKYAVTMPSARVGLWMALKALDARQGDGVILSALNFPVIPAIIRSMGLRPVFADVLPRTYNMDPRDIESRIGPEVKYILATHLFGHPVDMNPVMEVARKYGLRVIEDCAHACGSDIQGKKTGTFGDVACFSFGMGKSVVAFGGGMIATNDPAVAARVREGLAVLRPPGRCNVFKRLASGFLTASLMHPVVFSIAVYPTLFLFALFNRDPEQLLDLVEDKLPVKEADLERHSIRLSNIQAAFGREQLRRLDRLNGERGLHADMLTVRLSKYSRLGIPVVSTEAKSVHLYYALDVESPLTLKKHLIRKGIDSKLSSQVDCSRGDCPVAGALNGRIIKIPNFPGLSRSDMDYIASAIADYPAKGFYDCDFS